ncbi:MAG: hypothetical protein ACPG80_01320 [Rickettsiales bacterium]
MKQLMAAVMIAILGVSLLGYAPAMAQVPAQLKQNMGQAVQQSIGINPDDYPCAKAGIMALYENRQKISNLSAFHPKRLFAWMLETMSYYALKVKNFFMQYTNPDALVSGVKQMQSMATSGDPLGSMERKVDGWVSSISPRGQFVMQHKVENIIQDTTNADGSCKLGG